MQYNAADLLWRQHGSRILHQGHGGFLVKQPKKQQEPPLYYISCLVWETAVSATVTSSSLATVSPALSVQPNCSRRLLACVCDDLHLQKAQDCVASRRTQIWLTHDGLRTLVSTTDTMMTADLLPKGVPQTLSFADAKDSSKADAPKVLMQSLTRVQKHSRCHVALSTAPFTKKYQAASFHL